MDCSGIIGVGPIIAGWQDRKPVYCFDLLLETGETMTVAHEKACKGADPTAKGRAIFDRMKRAEALRAAGGVVLAHDRATFDALRQVVLRLGARFAA